MKHPSPALLAAILAAPLAGCSGIQPIVEGPAYPQAATPGETLNIQVFREGTRLHFTNTTARAFGPSTLWLNRWYSRDIAALAPGESFQFPLRDFKDPYGEPFRAGGFFAIERADTLAVAELHTASPESAPTILPLVVVQTGEQ